MAVDLHVHSTASDGSESPAAVVRLAVQAGLSAVALTDHDTLDGIGEARAEAGPAGIELVPGVEVACEWDRGGLHIVVLFLEPGPGPLQDRLAEFRAGRTRRNEAIARRLDEIGIDIDYEEVLARAGDGSVGRPHFAALLVAKGYVPDIPTAFREYLGWTGAAYATRPLLPPEEAIRLARRSGGVPVVAHPHTLGLNTAEEYAVAFRRLAGYGLVGVECFYGEYPTEVRRQFEETVRSFGLLPSGGSDFHGSYKPGQHVGGGRGDLVVPDRVLEDLRAARDS
ncbi:MAG: PHP domain-containing protein [Acidimicrobiia bacterium]|nr:PHP domain-containing protein [Acidimicrobiia bacterium]